MEVRTHKNLILVYHKGVGNLEHARLLTDAMRTAIAELKKQNLRVGIYHDVSDLESADNDYMTTFAGLAKELGKDGFVYVATIPKAWVRVLAKTASYLGGIETHFYKTPAESMRYLESVGFELPNEYSSVA